MTLTMTEWTTAVTALRRNMKTRLVNLPVSFIVSLSPEYTDTSVPLLCLVELLEFKNVCSNWTDSLTDIHRGIGSSYQHMSTTSTSPTCAVTERTPVAVAGSLEDYIIPDTDSVDYVGFLEGSIYDQPIGEASVDTYLRAADASTELVATAKMRDYVIDINIYRYVIKRKILQLRESYINSDIININRTVGFKLLKTKNCLDEKNHDDLFKLMQLENSNTVKMTCMFMNNNEISIYYMYKMLCCVHRNRLLNSPLSYDYVNDYIISNFNELKGNAKVRCAVCNFYHVNCYDDKSIIEFNNRYSLLSLSQCKKILKNCFKTINMII